MERALCTQRKQRDQARSVQRLWSSHFSVAMQSPFLKQELHTTSLYYGGRCESTQTTIERPNEEQYTCIHTTIPG